MKKVLNFLNHSLVIWILFLLLLIVAANYIFSSLIISFDATSDNRYSLSDSTKSLIRNLENPVEIRFYHSISNENVPIGIKNFGKRVESILKGFERNSKSKIKFLVYDPQPDSDDELTANNYGIAANPIGGENYFLGAAFAAGVNEQVISFFDPSRERFLEYDIVKVIYNLTTESKGKIGVLSSINLFGVEATPFSAARPDAYFISELKQLFEVINLDYANTVNVPDDVDILIVFHPLGIKTHVEYAIDQFIMRGGRVVMVYDSYMRTDPQVVNARRSGQQAYVSNSLPQRFLDSWQIEYTPENVLGDREFAAVVQTAQGSFSYALWFDGSAKALNPDSPISAGINSILFSEPAAFRFKEDKKDATDQSLKFTPIVSSSEDTGFVNTFAVAYIDLKTLNSNFKTENGRWNLVGMLDGVSKSSFDKKPVLSGEDLENTNLVESFNRLPEHIAKSDKKPRILLISDADFLMDDLVVERVNFLGQTISQPRNDNISLFFAAINDLQGDEKLSLIQPKSVGSRPFERFLLLQRDAQIKYNTTEQSLEQKLKETEESLKRLSPSQGSADFQLPDETVAKIKEYRILEAQTKKELRNIRKLLREDIDFLKNILILINLLLIPLIMTLIGVRIYAMRVKRV